VRERLQGVDAVCVHWVDQGPGSLYDLAQMCQRVYAERADKYAYVQFIIDAHVFFLILVYFCKIVA
jgi:hypothetical protein